MHGQSDDIAVIQLVLQGQQSAYGVLVEKYQQYVFTLVMRHVNNRELAEELAQDVFVKAYKYLADFRGTSKFSTWLFTIVNTTCLSHHRKKKDGVILLEEEKIVAIADNHSGVHPSPDHEKATTRILIGNAMKYIPEQDAQILTLFYLAEQSADEIGTILGLTTSNVKVRLFRARLKLKEVLEKRYSKEFIVQ